LDHTKDFKNGICCFSCFKTQHLRVAQRIKTVMDYTLAKERLIQSWRYTLAVIKRHKNRLSLSFITIFENRRRDVVSLNQP